MLAVVLAVGLAPVDAEAARPAKKQVKVSKAAKPRVVKLVRKAPPKIARKAAPVIARKAAPVIPRAAVAAPLRLIDGKPALTSTAAFVIDQDTGEVLLGKNDEAVRPIASLTKLMAGVIIADARLPMDERIEIVDDDVDRLKHSSSRLKVGTVLTRREALHISLMSSENRATHALARTYPGGLSAFVDAMNNKARQLGMDQTRYVEPTGLSSRNRSSARDLALLTDAAYDRPLLREYSTSPGYRLGSLQYVNSNRLVRSGWDVGVQKTGYINEAGPTLLMQTKVEGRKLIMVFLDATSKVARFKDADTVRRWLKSRD